MQAPATPTAQGGSTRVRVDPVVVAAIACIIVGWFLMNACVTQAGPLRLEFGFYNIPDLLRYPGLLFTGVRSRSVNSIAFGFLALLVAVAPLAPYVAQSKNAWAASLSPLALMLLCGAALYLRASPEYFTGSSDTGDIGRDLLHLANELAGKVTGAVAKHISVGMGTYLSLAASIVLAVRGWTTRQRS